MERFSRTLVVLCCFFLGLTVFATLSLAEEDSLQLSPKVELVNAFPNLRFSSVVALLPNPSKKDNLLYVVQLDGKVYVFPNDPISKSKDVKLFFDISDRIVNEGEMGLLGFAFHPKFPKVPYFYVNYNRDLGGQQYVTVISRFTADSRKQASTKEELVLLQIPQPFLTQKGGPLLFDREGYLLIGLGDGGGNGDPLNHGQDGQSLLGKILRIDVDRQEGGLPYSIPDSNPFVDQSSGVRPEIYALGLRNPWRCSYDKKKDNLWCADVGEASWEEVNIIQKGGNYGWSITEGPTCFKQLGCVVGSYAAPVYWYPHPDLQLPTLFNGVALIGGHVYRGKAIPELRGSYVFGDFINPKIGCLTKRDGVWRDSIVVPDVGKLLVIGFGVDSNKELFVLTYGEDQPIYRLRLASCGNGKVDKDEECDYGDKSFDSWKERCCDKQTCQRLKKSQC